MNAWAGSWLICSVTIERTMQMSSAIVGDVREQVGDLLPGLAVLLEVDERAAGDQLRALELGELLALGEAIRGTACRCRRFSSGL